MVRSSITALVTALVAGVGCSTAVLPVVEAGWVEGYASGPESVGFAVDFHVPMTALEGGVLLSTHFRSEHLDSDHGPERHRVSVGADATWYPVDAPVTPVLRLGIAVASFEVWGDELAFGMLSPLVQGGVAVVFDRDRKGTGVSSAFQVLAGTEYEWRFTDQPSGPVWMVVAGLVISAH